MPSRDNASPSIWTARLQPRNPARRCVPQYSRPRQTGNETRTPAPKELADARKLSGKDEKDSQQHDARCLPRTSTTRDIGMSDVLQP